MKLFAKEIAHKLSGIITLFILGGLIYIFSGNLLGLIKWIWAFGWFIGPFAILIISIPFWPSIKGAYGEYLVRQRLKVLDDKQYLVMHNLLIRLEIGKTSQVDHIVVSPYGIFVIETKNFSGWIIGDERSEYWTQIIFRSKKRFYNPIWQNYTHIKALKEVLKDIDGIQFIPIVIFSGNAVLKRVNSSQVTYLNNLIDFIKTKQVPIMDYDKMALIFSRLQAAITNSKRVYKNHIDNIKKKSESKSIICPICGSPMVQRQGRYGPFIGCSGFPKCRYIYKGQ